MVIYSLLFYLRKEQPPEFFTSLSLPQNSHNCFTQIVDFAVIITVRPARVTEFRIECIIQVQQWTVDCNHRVHQVTHGLSRQVGQSKAVVHVIEQKPVRSSIGRKICFSKVVGIVKNPGGNLKRNGYFEYKMIFLMKNFFFHITLQIVTNTYKTL